MTSLASTTIRTATGDGGVYSGNYLKIDHFNHGMYSNTNKVTLSDVQSNIAPTTLSAALTVSKYQQLVLQIPAISQPLRELMLVQQILDTLRLIMKLLRMTA